MRIINESALAECRRRLCEFRQCPCSVTEPHHVHTKGEGRVDTPWNLIALCKLHHTAHHYGGQPGTKIIKAIVARREGVSADDIDAEYYRILRLDKHADPNTEAPKWCQPYREETFSPKLPTRKRPARNNKKRGRAGVPSNSANARFQRGKARDNANKNKVRPTKS